MKISLTDDERFECVIALKKQIADFWKYRSAEIFRNSIKISVPALRKMRKALLSHEP